MTSTPEQGGTDEICPYGPAKLSEPDGRVASALQNGNAPQPDLDPVDEDLAPAAQPALDRR